MNESSGPSFHLPDNNPQSSTFKQSSSQKPLLQLNETKTSTNDHPRPKFLIITRENSSETLEKVSPFLIKKAIDSTCEGEVELCKKIPNGKILVKTKDEIQAKKLIELTAFSPEIQVDIEEHPTLNYSKGVIYSNDLRNMSEEEILAEMRNQNVVEVKKILKSVDGVVKETGLIILTFDSPDLPCEIAIGYEKVNIRPYIPLPLRCNKCLSYGHVTKNCNNTKICPNCASDFHTTPVENDQCNFSKKCINCMEVKGQDQNHNAYDKKCPVFLKEKEILTIMTLERVERREAIKIYEERQLHNKSDEATPQAHMASIENRNPLFQSTKPSIKPTGAIHTLAATTRAAVKYSYIISESLSPFVTFKDGKVGVNFGGYHAEAGLGGLLTGNAAHGGLSASAGTPWGPQAAAGLNGALDGRAAGGAYAGAQFNPNVGASSVLSGSVGDVNHGFAGAEAHSNRNHVSKTLGQEAPLPPIVPSDTSYNNIHHAEPNGIQKIKPPKKYNVIKVEDNNADAPPSIVHSKQVSKSVISTGDNGYEHKHSDVQVGNGLIGNVLNIPIGILRSLQDSLGGLNIHKSTSQTRV